ncbi:unnamed protein product, partial [Nesidiocoris tenuis]
MPAIQLAVHQFEIGNSDRDIHCTIANGCALITRVGAFLTERRRKVAVSIFCKGNADDGSG